MGTATSWPMHHLGELMVGGAGGGGGEWVESKEEVGGVLGNADNDRDGWFCFCSLQ